MPCGCATLTLQSDGRALSAILEGPTTKPRVVGGDAGRLKLLVTIECKPAGLYALTGIPQSELADRTLPFEAVDARLSRSLCEMVENAGSIDELAAGLDTLLLGNIVADGHPQLLPALQSVLRSAGDVDVKRLSDDVHYSQRQLNRIFKQQVGVGVKSFARLLRVNHAFRLLKRPGASVTLVSDSLAFHDLSHFVRDFRSVCGITPQAFRSNLSDFYINTAKF